MVCIDLAIRHLSVSGARTARLAGRRPGRLRRGFGGFALDQACCSR